jgi:hypothetical protein
LHKNKPTKTKKSMNKYEKLVAGEMEAEELGSKSTREGMMENLRNDLENPKNAGRAVAALTNWESIDPKGPRGGGHGNGIEKSLALEVRRGETNPTKEAQSLYEQTTGSPMRGKNGRTEKDIIEEEIWEGFEASGFQNGEKPKTMAREILEAAGGWQASGKGKETWGPAKIVEGILSQDAEKAQKGFEDCAKTGLGEHTGKLLDTLDTMGKNINKEFMEQVMGLITGEKRLGKTIEGLLGKEGGEKPEGPEGGVGKTMGMGQIGAGMAIAFKIFETLQKSAEKIKDTDKGAPEGSWEKSLQEKGGKDSYLKAKEAGLESPEAGGIAEETAGMLAKAGKNIDSNKEMFDKALEGTKAAKDLAVKTANKALMATPGGQAAAVALEVGNALADMAIDAVKGALAVDMAGGKAGLAENQIETGEAAGADGPQAAGGAATGPTNELSEVSPPSPRTDSAKSKTRYAKGKAKQTKDLGAMWAMIEEGAGHAQTGVTLGKSGWDAIDGRKNTKPLGNSVEIDR